MKLYIIKDNLIGFTNPPFPCQSDEAAKRLFVMLARESQQNIVNQYPENTELWKLGELDEKTGQITSDVVFLDKALPYIPQPVPVPQASPWTGTPKTEPQEVKKNDGSN